MRENVAEMSDLNFPRALRMARIASPSLDEPFKYAAVVIVGMFVLSLWNNRRMNVSGQGETCHSFGLPLLLPTVSLVHDQRCNELQVCRNLEHVDGVLCRAYDTG